MAMRGGPRLQVGSAAWAAEERASALNIADSEIEEFSFAARNEVDWLNEHLAEIFSENQMNVAELFKTPGKLRGRTPRTAKKINHGDVRVPLSDVFSSTPKGAPNPFSLAHLAQSRTPKIKVAEDGPVQLVQPASRPASPAKTAVALSQHALPAIPLADSGYHGSQSQDTMDLDHEDKEVDMLAEQSPLRSPQRGMEMETENFVVFTAPSVTAEAPSPTAASEETFESAKEEQTTRQVTAYVTAKVSSVPSPAFHQATSPSVARSYSPFTSPRSPSPKKMTSPLKSSPHKSSPLKQASSPLKQAHRESLEAIEVMENEDDDEDEDDEGRSPSDGSSPIRPAVRKPSLNFASLPAREPLTSNRMSRTSQLDLARPSYYNRQTGGKSLGNVIRPDIVDDDDHDEMDIDEDTTVRQDNDTTKIAAHNKTYTQRLQDQISMLGKSQSSGPRQSKSIANLLPQQHSQPSVSSQPSVQAQPVPEPKRAPSPKPKKSMAPGAFPEDDDDDWIAPPSKPVVAASPRPEMVKSHSTDIMESLAGKETVGGSEFALPRSRPASPNKGPLNAERTVATSMHNKSASVPSLPALDMFAMGGGAVSPKKTISVSNPSLAPVAEDGTATPSKSPSRTFRDSPLKQVKNKLSSILKSSKGLLASSAAISAEGKSSLLSPSTSRLGYFHGPSVESFRTAENVMYPDLTQHGASTSRPASPARTNSSRRTRASTEREKKETEREKKENKEREKEREKEIKAKEKEARDAKRLVEEMEKREKELQKARSKEQEKARHFSKEQDKLVAMEKQISAQREQAPQPPAQVLRTPGPPAKTAPQSPPKATRTSPRKPKEAFSDDMDIDMVDATTVMPPPSIPRSAAPPTARAAGVKRPTKPSKDDLAKSRQAPTVIKVHPNSTQQFHSNSVLAGSLQQTLAQPQPPPRQLNSKASQGSLHAKQSMQSLKSSTSGRPKALDQAAKRKEQEERDAQRKRETKIENDRKRAAQEEERRQEQQRKAETERQREEARKQAAKKATLEKAKQTRAPPPASRSQPNGPPEYNTADKGPSRPPSRLGSTMQQDSRLVNTVLSNTGKAASKRPLQQDGTDELSRPQPQRKLPSYQSGDTKRMRMSEEFDEDIEMADSQRHIKGPPVRPSAAYKKELPPPKTVFGNGYTNAPAQSTSRDLFKTAVSNSHSKPARPLDMAQVSSAAINFAPNPNAGQPQAHKTPARPAATKVPKSTVRKSPRFQNGEAIELPEIQTDDEDEEDDEQFGVAPWADSPALRAALANQERMDPMQIFGPPAPLNMEEVFSKSKDRWHKFRARTSSANWSGSDRLTEEEIRKDLQAQDKMRRDGGWSYELGRQIQ
ncbi:hypothetical protein B0H63DRAFT_467304 [Podospora didyma]|uniref:Inner centromere protein ARK-binding domain-containing protein n=1 Tax=Podospora didyma TaxID=330526 RepID=A0AAE0U5E6_9PEZI|nr:hypothetical protein B0H63DRAFT_467304 [Podospora didyma]